MSNGVNALLLFSAPHKYCSYQGRVTTIPRINGFLGGKAGKKRLVGCVAEFLIDVSRLCMYPRGVPHKPRLTVVNYSF